MISDSLDKQIVRYKTIYAAAALILGVGTALGGWWLGGLDGYHTEAQGLLLYVFGCAILYNNNNMYPSLWLIVIGLLVVTLTQYRVRTSRQLKKDNSLAEPAVRAKFTHAVAGLLAGLLITVYGLTFAESGTNLCPADLVPDFPFRLFSAYFGIGVVLMVIGIVIVIATRFRIRISTKDETAA